MTNVLIRKLIGHGLSPEDAYDVCLAYLTEFTLADLEKAIESIDKEANKDVDKIQSKSYWKGGRRLLCESDLESIRN